MARIAEQVIEQVRSSIDIIDIIGEYVQLTKRGYNFFGLCPFHMEKTPSFAVNPSKQIYKCFGCGVGGGTINFIMEIEKLEFIEAIKFLADKYNIEVNLNTKKSSKFFSQLFEIHNLAANLYQQNLKTNKGLEIVKYLNDRGINNNTISEFQIGFSINKWSSVLDEARKNNFKSDALIQSGLFINGDKGYYDRFRNRIMFPITDRNNKIIAFGGRVFDSNDPAKYINSSETPIYNKSKIFYGLSNTKGFLSKENTAIVVEGYLDLIQLFQNNIKNVVAVSGTSFTDSHALELNKYVKNVKIAYDGDNAGKNAAIRAGYVLLKNGFFPEIVVMPEGTDPDDWIQKEGPNPLKNAIANSINLFEFQYKKSDIDNENPNLISNLVNDILKEISDVQDPVHKELCIRSIAKVTKLNENTLFESISNINSKKSFKTNYDKARKKTDNKDLSNYNLLEDELIQICFSNDFKTRLFIYENMNTEWLISKSVKLIYDEIFIHLHSDHKPDINIVMDGIKDPNYRQRFATLIFDIDKKNLSIDAAIECLTRIEKIFLKKKLNSLRENLNKFKSDELKSILIEISNIQSSLNNIKFKYDKFIKN
tara:strand:+ start:245 stop:2026 length:1782 start_codon:yes stop_codon:yes gene_type:complete